MENKLHSPEYSYDGHSDKLVKIELSPNKINAIIRSLSYTRHVERWIVLDIIGTLTTQSESQL